MLMPLRSNQPTNHSFPPPPISSFPRFHFPRFHFPISSRFRADFGNKETTDTQAASLMFGKSRNSPLGPGEKEGACCLLGGAWGSNWGAGHRKLGEKSGARPLVPLHWFRVLHFRHISLSHWVISVDDHCLVTGGPNDPPPGTKCCLAHACHANWTNSSPL
ncbi:hypothetical protein BDP81DRAFT_84296 [Colletotrichum phormii]|uniref:Uncharacterized protein n=1 Tax=Colletotrichum phormii TaxID=359342 RepID=A0AAJ0A3T2_9PEZI|nr:uncharacterized protein BDP81DRAFT_84296 [Colletotrichum phormii]KAK1654502.1 hypothetical protein BDP81DRAFT_84296 [Colletotrichum phormii]